MLSSRTLARALPLWIGLALTANSAWSGPKYPKIEGKQCAVFFEEIMQDTDEDLALIPYLHKALIKIYEDMHVKGLDDAAFVDHLVDEDTRKFAYKLSGMGEALDAVDDVYFPQIRAKGRGLENLIGDYTFETEMRAFVLQPEFASKVTPRIKALFEGRVAAARDNLLRNLRREGWTGDKGDAYKMIHRWLELSDPVTKRSVLKKKLLKSMAGHLEDVHKKIVKKKLDPNEIEDGLHRMRRLLRKIPIVVNSFEGMFYLDEELVVKGVDAYLREDVRTPKRFRLKEKNLLKRAVPISQNGYTYLVQLMEDFAALKAGDGMKEFVYHVLKASKLGAEGKPLLAAVAPSGSSAASFAKTRKQGKLLFDQIVETEILLQLAKQFREAADEY